MGGLPTGNVFDCDLDLSHYKSTSVGAFWKASVGGEICATRIVAILSHLATYTFIVVDERCLYWALPFHLPRFSFSILIAAQQCCCTWQVLLPLIK